MVLLISTQRSCFCCLSRENPLSVGAAPTNWVDLSQEFQSDAINSSEHSQHEQDTSDPFEMFLSEA